MSAPAQARRTLLGRAVLVAVGAGAVVLGAQSMEPAPTPAPRAAAAVSSAPAAPVTPLAAESDLVDASVSTGLRPVTRALGAVVAGRQSWVRIPWTTDAPVCSVAVTVTADGADVGYPVNTGGYSSFYRQDRLAASVHDYTAVRFLVPAFSAAKVVTADVTASYTTTSGAGTASTAGATGKAGTAARASTPPCVGTSVTRTYRVTLPVQPPSAAPAAALADPAAATASSAD
ncbi:hypothetical protein ASH01_16615 [Terrabacter sp. Soil811]|uniref:hypothetical protein n=1 Tax=Terrabacter sp. Soil811 TaxID=1736419 RepID=UPI0006FF1238|nr:hypothetical protein [Terrabacter sp. Soil811]KRF42458.1 hypothetical protein ASH01_16615 [Terrabacter sp. Soil811]